MAHKSKKARDVLRVPVRGGEVREFRIDTSQLTNPPLAGYADRCSLTDRGNVLEFHFFEVGSSAQPVTIARVAMPIDDVIIRLWRNSVAFYRGIRESFGELPIENTGLSTHVSVPESTGAMALVNLITINRLGVTGAIDCFYVTPRSTVQAVTGGGASLKPEVLPIVRIQVPTVLVIGILSRVEGLLMTFRERLLSIPEFVQHAALLDKVINT